MWEAEIIKNGNFNVVYFDAFQNDFQSDPFIAIASHIYSKIDDNELKDKYLSATKKVASVLLKTSLKIGISTLTLGAVKGSELESFGDDISSAINDPLEKYIEEKITQLDKENNTLEHFRSTLSDIATEKKLIFIIDELDRARPNYSLELLERVKHVFNTKNIYFILSTDKDQFIKIIQKTYGPIDASILRDAERCYSLLLLCNTNFDNGLRWEYQIGVAIAVFLKLKDESLLIKIKERTITKNHVMEELGVSALPEDDNYHILLALNTEYLTHEGYAKAISENDQMVFRDSFGRQPLTISHAIDLIYNIK
ncbi:P-loop domain protein, KAP family [Cooperia oncophora]